MKNLIFHFQTRIVKAGGDLSNLGPRLYKVNDRKAGHLFRACLGKAKDLFSFLPVALVVA